ncbi:carbohydrate kinase, YjeF related protein [Pyrolobus fumarii 1A]|uniref:Bifunctional NAD(P)H-hydrate repair enzyme n=1 Tax=Pyrolobus fumarii (strain DSM 11204 / 1A) TaxID=694429 RepID=G0EEK8_PYRF1|nr:bifunctional ADP-dependent NAD(P)H-hydrate dehydratase/NAD(P)H-hydrate epimerase [Pyrolobus fumarii]AEM38830.1 carbohydrate kinase, YjeF related protein [Pyrolobus fumarii 1A]
MLGAICTTREMRAWEINSAHLGVPTRLLMENAGATVARIILERFKPRTVSVVAGVGGKAGDGLVAARHLSTAGVHVRVFLVSRPESIHHPDTLDALKAAEAAGVELHYDYMRWADSDWLDADVIVDAMLGTGVRGELRRPYREIVEEINRSGRKVVAIDIPTGIDPDTGKVLGTAVKADITVTMHCIKAGLKQNDGPRHAGEIVVANIGLPRDAWLYIGPGDLEVLLPRRREWARKGEAGRVLVVGGSKWFYGAPWIAALSAFYAGADLVYLAAPEPVFNTVVSPEIIPVPLPGDILRVNHARELEDRIQLADVILVGPGIGAHRESWIASRLIVKRALELGKLVVVDADGLKALTEYATPQDRIESLDGKAILTPHVGEASLLLGKRIGHEDIEARIEAAKHLADKLSAVVILKGRIDVVAKPGGYYRLNRSGTPDMSAGGTGDVLAGVTAGLLAEIKDPWIAAQLAAYVTGVAGEEAVREQGRAAPSLLIREVSRTLSRVRYKYAS